MHGVRSIGCTKLSVLALAVLVSAAAQTVASLATGVRGSEGLYIQEYWQDDVPKFAVHNARDDTLVVTVRRVTMGARRHVPQGAVVMITPPTREVTDTLAIWWLEPKGVTLLPAVGIPDEPVRHAQLAGLYADGVGVGIWADAGIHPPGPKSRIVTYASLNVPGRRSLEAWVEQDRLWFESGEQFDLDFMLAGGSGVFELRHGGTWQSIPRVVVVGARCATLQVTELENTIEIDALNVSENGKLHRVSVSCVAPQVERPTMVCVGGILHVHPGRVTEALDRGILVRPGEVLPDPPAN